MKYLLLFLLSISLLSCSKEIQDNELDSIEQLSIEDSEEINNLLYEFERNLRQQIEKKSEKEIEQYLLEIDELTIKSNLSNEELNKLTKLIGFKSQENYVSWTNKVSDSLIEMELI